MAEASTLIPPHSEHSNICVVTVCSGLSLPPTFCFLWRTCCSSPLSGCVIAPVSYHADWSLAQAEVNGVSFSLTVSLHERGVDHHVSSQVIKKRSRRFHTEAGNWPSITSPPLTSITQWSKLAILCTKWKINVEDNGLQDSKFKPAWCHSSVLPHPFRLCQYASRVLG